MDDTFFDIPVNIKTEFDRRVAKVFRIYDHQNNNMIDSKNVGVILRILGCAPTEKQIQELVKETQFEENKGVIHLAGFLNHFRKLLQNGHMKPYSADELFNVFKLLDPKNRGYIPKAEFIKIMSEIGEPINENELKEMLNVCLDPITLRINYEEYIRKLTYEPHNDDSIYKLAELTIQKK